jgi:hypothetical protein
MLSSESLRQVDCPVCDRQYISDIVCPNCGTDLTVLRMLSNLEPVPIAVPISEQATPIARPNSRLIWVLLILSGLTFGGMGYVLAAIQNHQAGTQILTQAVDSAQVSSSPASVLEAQSVANSSAPKVSPSMTAQNTHHCFNYSVRAGDSLTQIAWMFYGNADYWQTIAKVNPRLKQTQYRLETTEKLCIPNL